MAQIPRLARPNQATDRLAVDEFCAVRAADVVVTMGCGDACPIYPGKRYEDWQVGDPAEASSIAEVRAIRDDIDQRVQRLIGELGITVVTGA